MNRHYRRAICAGLCACFALSLTSTALAAEEDREIEQRVEDATITARIETALLLDDNLNPLDINTTTKNGVVSLTGTVESDVERDTAISIAKSVDGVTNVIDNLEISREAIEVDENDPDVQWQHKMENIGQTAAVRMRLVSHGEISGLDIDVDSRGGLVVLSGEAASERQKAKAERIARETRGVTEVENNIVVREPGEIEGEKNLLEEAGETVNDEWVEKKVETVVVLNRDVSMRNFDIDVEDGVCTITGEVISNEEKELVGQHASEVDGVPHVINSVDVVAWNE